MNKVVVGTDKGPHSLVRGAHSEQWKPLGWYQAAWLIVWVMVEVGVTLAVRVDKDPFRR